MRIKGVWLKEIEKKCRMVFTSLFAPLLRVKKDEKMKDERTYYTHSLSFSFFILFLYLSPRLSLFLWLSLLTAIFHSSLIYFLNLFIFSSFLFLVLAVFLTSFFSSLFFLPFLFSFIVRKWKSSQWMEMTEKNENKKIIYN